jgi:hypothetical protein
MQSLLPRPGGLFRLSARVGVPTSVSHGFEDGRIVDPDGVNFVKAIAFAGASYFAVRWAVLLVAFITAANGN